jgi:SAM-dependent methyltransferase
MHRCTDAPIKHFRRAAMTTSTPTTGPAGANGPLRGSAARDWATIQERQFRAGFIAVPDHYRVGPGTRLLDAGCGAGMAAQLAAARGATVAGYDAAEALLTIARERTPGGDFRLADLEDVPFPDHSFDPSFPASRTATSTRPRS